MPKFMCKYKLIHCALCSDLFRRIINKLKNLWLFIYFFLTWSISVDEGCAGNKKYTYQVCTDPRIVIWGLIIHRSRNELLLYILNWFNFSQIQMKGNSLTNEKKLYIKFDCDRFYLVFQVNVFLRLKNIVELLTLRLFANKFCDLTIRLLITIRQ